MQELWKLKVLVLQEDVEPVLLFLGKMGVAHFIDVSGTIKMFDKFLNPYEAPREITVQVSDILKRIDHILKGLELDAEGTIRKESLISETTIQGILSKANGKLSEIEERSKPFLEAINFSSNLIRKIDQMLEAQGVHIKKLHQKETAPIKGDPKETLSKAERRLLEIERLFNETVDVYNRCLHIHSKIELLSKNLKGKQKQSPAPVEKFPFPPEEKFLDYTEMRLSEIEGLMTTNQAKDFHITELMTIKTTIERLIKEAYDKKAELLEQLAKLRNLVNAAKQSIKEEKEFETIYFELLSLRETAKKVEDVIKIENGMGYCANTVYFEAWVQRQHFQRIFEGIKKITNGRCIVEGEPPACEDTVPTIIKSCPQFFEAFEKLVFALGCPLHTEVNPVFIVAVTFPLLFGIMFADVGQGAILLMVGLLLKYFRGKNDITNIKNDIARYFLFSSGLLIMCGISSMFFGLLFGEFFGPSGLIHPWIPLKIGPFRISGFDPMHAPLDMLRFSILIGVVLLTLGLILRVLNNLRGKNYKQALISVCWLWLFLGGFFMWIYWGGISNIMKWFTEGSTMFIGLLILPALIMSIISATSGGIMEGIDISIEILIGSLDHLVSFSRLAALFLTHAALNYMFLMLAGVKNGYFPLQSIPIIAAGSILSLGIEGLVIFVHCLRLHWVELLPEFYIGKGVPFKPFKI